MVNPYQSPDIIEVEKQKFIFLSYVKNLIPIIFGAIIGNKIGWLTAPYFMSLCELIEKLSLHPSFHAAHHVFMTSHSI